MANNSGIELLDCTLRDGGLCLEDAYMNGLSDRSYSQQARKGIAEHLRNSNVEIIELGSIEISEDNKERFAIYQCIEDISSIMPREKQPGQEFAALYRGPDTPLEDIPEWKTGYCKVIRVILRYSELQKSLNFCAALARKGYCVFVQPMLTMRYSEEEINQVIKAANDMGAYALYFVDSYGYMQEEDVRTLFHKYDDGLNREIRIGFHAHNNMDLAFSNTQVFLDLVTERTRIVDSCIMGIGQGAGNLQTEVITDHLNQHYKKAYDFDSVLNASEIVETLWNRSLWGFSIEYLLPAIHKTAYKYSSELRHRYGLSFREINKLLANIPEELRQRFTRDNTMELLHRCGYQV